MAPSTIETDMVNPSVSSTSTPNIPFFEDKNRQLSELFFNVLYGQEFPPFSFSTGNAASQIIAIDSKIEQAMDLVKTHLMFAVREEVEILRAKIVELDSTISRLQNENAILREHVPQEILQNLDGSRSLSPTLSNSATSTTNAIVAAQ
jgi:hypothetical protein